MGIDNLLKNHDKIIESLRTKAKNDSPSHDIITDDFQTNFYKTLNNKVENYQKTDTEKFKSYVFGKAQELVRCSWDQLFPPVGIALAVEAGAAAGGIGFIGRAAVGGIAGGFRALFRWTWFFVDSYK